MLNMSRLRAPALALALALNAAPGAHAAGPPEPDWPTLDALSGAGAYPAVSERLAGVDSDPRRDPFTRARAAYRRGLALLATGRQEEGLAALAQVDPASPFHTRALSARAEALVSTGREAEAIALFERLEGLTAGDAKAQAAGRIADLHFVAGRYAEALARYRELAQGGSAQAERALYAWGWTLARMDQGPAALNLWRQALEKYPTSRHAQAARLALANLLMSRGETLAASTYYNEAARSGADAGLMDRAEMLAGEAYADSRDFALAQSHYRAVRPGSPLIELARYGDAYASWQLGAFESAKKAFTAWLALYPASPQRVAARFALGKIARAQAEPETARKHFEAVLGLAPGSRWAEDARFEELSMAFERGAMAEAAERASAMAAAPDGRYAPQALWLLGEARLQLQQAPAAVAAFEKLAARPAPAFLAGRPDALPLALGMAYYRAGRLPDAARTLAAVTGGPAYADALFYQAEARFATGEPAEARRLYEQFLARFATDARAPQAAYGLGWSGLGVSDPALAEAAFARALAGGLAGPARADAKLRAGQAATENKRYAEALAYLEAALADPELGALAPEARYAKAWALYRQGSLEAAAAAMQAVAEADPEGAVGARARLWQGRALYRLNRPEPAIAALQAALRHPAISPGGVREAREQLASLYQAVGRNEDAQRLFRELAADAESGLDAERADTYRLGLVQALLAAGKPLDAREAILSHAGARLTETESAQLAMVAERLAAQGAWREVKATVSTYRERAESVPPRLWLALGAAQQAEGDAAAAQASFTQAAAQLAGAEKARALGLLAGAQQAAGDLAGAERSWTEAAGLAGPTLERAQALLSAARVVLSGPDSARGLGLLKQAATEATLPAEGRRQAWMALGDAQRDRKAYAAALEAYRGAKAASPAGSLGAALGGYWGASMLMELKQPQAVLQELAALKFPAGSAPLPGLAGLKQGEALERLGRWKDAYALYTRLAAEQPGAEGKEAATRKQWIEKNVPAEMRR